MCPLAGDATVLTRQLKVHKHEYNTSDEPDLTSDPVQRVNSGGY